MGASLSDAGPGPQHAPVLYQQVLAALEPRAGGHYIDGTLGGGGHARGILEAAGPDGELLGLDRDPQALKLTAARLEPFGGRVHLRQATFAEMTFHASALGWKRVDGILLDLGLSSMQLDDPARGFSFRFEAPLDMRFDPAQRLTAAEIVNGWPEDDLAEVLRDYGEQPGAGRVAQAIIAARPIRTTTELAGVVVRAAGRSRSGVHPATQTFQALRIAVNEELEALERGLEAVPGLLEEGGKLVVISFHSLEDRLVKRFLRREERDCVCPPRQPVCTCGHQATLVVPVRRPIRPEAAETSANPRARSARMRFGERLGAARSLHKRNRVGSSR
ncbi:MAG: mraW [Anaerolineales bacterium]|nr:mraW [Anaerolineales bacterium]MBM2842704.1 mraW [Anaerolineales bacterium]